jgi:hypothetical protein
LSRKQKFNYWKNPEKTARYDRIINELCHFYKVSCFLWVFPIIEFLLPGQKFTATLLNDILAILGIIWAYKVFLDCFYN